MHVIFAVSAVALLLATLWMMARDHRDEWRVYQKQADELRARQVEKQLAMASTEEYERKIEELATQRSEATQALEAQSAEIDELNTRISTVKGAVELATREVKFKGAERDVARANYDIGVRDALPVEQLNELKARFDAEETAWAALSLDLQVKEAELAQLRGELSARTARLDDLTTQQKSLETDTLRLEKTLTQIAPPAGSFQSFKRWLMLQPIVDGFNSPHRIQQEWLPDLTITLGMAEVARFDRCRTCHVNIDEFGAGNVPNFPHGEAESGGYPHPFSSHPRPDVYVTSASPHPMPSFGCTICHDGDGSGTSFRNAEHSPNDPAAAEHWHEQFGWHSNHFWEYPMRPGRLLESTCLKCHHSVVELGINEKYGATAPQVFEGYELVKNYGCFGCHEINGYDGVRPIGPDLRLEPNSAEELARIEADPNQVPGTMRKVGPSLRHVSSKMSPEFVAYWTEIPSRFRPDTKMPQFFHLTNQRDELAERYQPAQISAMATYLAAKAEPLDLLQPREGYQPDVARGRTAFARRGCLACHTHGATEFTGIRQDFGPDLTKVHEKIRPGRDGFLWLYTWIREPMRHHPRTRMPVLYLDAEGEGETYVDPAADIAAFLLDGGPGQFPTVEISEPVLDELVELFARRSLTESEYQQMLSERAFPRPAESIKSDEIELARREGDPPLLSDAEWQHRKALYVGRRTISFYGCYGCHDIPGFEAARPIGTALQDWGRKETSKLAPEHIEEFLHHHTVQGQPLADGHAGHGATSAGEMTLSERVERAVARQLADGDADPADLSAAFFYESLIHHGREGFLWQKLRQPRSYDYRKIETKAYDERLRMPQFPFTESQIEAVATFVLGLVADPPPEQYLFRPEGPAADRIEGERLLAKFNCAGCHVLELPEITYAAAPGELVETPLGPGDHEEARELLLRLKPPRNGDTGEVLPSGEKVVRFRGLLSSEPLWEEDPEFHEYGFDLWETLEVDGQRLLPASKMLVPAARLISHQPARGGQFAEWLVSHLMNTQPQMQGNRSLAWQASPPPLYKEGIKVQTPWMYQFLRNPEQLRYTTVLRMPRFNLSDDEALTLANYFAAVDGAGYPYQSIPQQQPAYLEAAAAEFQSRFPGAEGDYLETSWKLLNAPVCIKCHSVGGRPYQSTDPQKDIRGPNLNRVAERLRPDWMLLWLYKPSWITPYTSMPANYPKNQSQLPELFGGDGGAQTVATRDALMNYDRLMEVHGRVVYEPATPLNPGAPQTGAGGE
jgi:mono/diheme cytochrome c family protein